MKKYYSTTIFLTQTINSIGYLHTIDEETPAIELSEMELIKDDFTPQNLITGITVSRLEEVKTYNLSIPYQIGVNGVKQIFPDRIVYVIDGIQYTTFLNDETTYYSFGIGGLNDDNSVNLFVVKRESDSFEDKKPTENDIFIERNEMSVFRQLYKLNDINSIDDFENYF